MMRVIPVVHTATVSIVVWFFRLNIPGRVESLNISPVNPSYVLNYFGKKC